MKAKVSLARFDTSVPTLGYAVIDWIEHYLVQPDGDNAGGPFRLTREQVNFVLWYYAIDANGRFLYRRAVLRRAKGWGKSPFLGALCLAELCGPVRFAGFDENGDALAKPEASPWIVVAGVSETQTENTLGAIRGLLEGSLATEVYGIDVGLTRIYTPNGKIVPITASSSSQEGARPTFAVLDETHHWTASNGGAALAKVIRRNLGKIPHGTARSIETTNAHEPGRESVAEGSYLAHLAVEEGTTKASGVLYDSREAPADVDLADEEQLRAGLRCAYGDAVWLDLDRLVGEIYDPMTPPEESRRFYLNQIIAAADAWIVPTEWDANEREDLAPLKRSEPGKWRDADTVTLGFDGSLTDDSTALVATRVSDGAAFLIGLWEKPDGPAGQGWSVDKEIVREIVDHTFATLDVVAFASDVAYWETDVDAWRDTYAERLLVKSTTRHAIAWDMRGHAADTVRAVEATNRAIVDGELPHDGDTRLARHVKNARRRPNRYGVSFGKESRESPKKVDAVAALVLSRMVRNRVLAEGVLDKRRGKVGVLVGF